MVEASPCLGIVSAFCDESFSVLRDAVTEDLFGLLIGVGISSRILWSSCCGQGQGEECPTTQAPWRCLASGALCLALIDTVVEYGRKPFVFKGVSSMCF